MAAVEALLAHLEAPGGSYPIMNLPDPAFSQAQAEGPPAKRLPTPFAAEVRLCSPSQMRPILQRLWDLGIPHVTVIVGRQPDAAALVQAVERAGDLGMITGVRGRGSDLDEGNLVADMIAAGLDHLDVYCLSAEDQVHDALAGPGDREKAVRTLATALKGESCPVAQLALVRPTIGTIEATLEALARRGLTNASVFAVATADPADAPAGPLLADELIPAARMVEELAEQFGVRLMWCPPVKYDASKDVGEQVCRGPRCGGDTAIRVEPDGSVVAARGPFSAIGNLITQDWAAMEQSEVYQRYRNRLESNTHCDTCPGLAICAADCPREPAGWAAAERDILNEEAG